MIKIYVRFFLFLALFTLFINEKAFSQICATPGADGAVNSTLPNNTFFPSKPGNYSLPAGSKSMELSAVPGSFTVGGVVYSFGNTQISKGDLLLIIQMQGAGINTENSAKYGSGLASNNGSGYSNIANVGFYEYVVALNDVPLSGGTLNFKGAGSTGGLVNTFLNENATATSGQKRFQIVRLMQYSNLTLSADIKTVPWNGTAGGVIALDVAGTLDFNGHVIDASMTGFRGGYMPVRAIANLNQSLYVTTDDNKAATKGEGVAGTPRYMWDGYNEVDNGAAWLGYPGGDYGRGAPGNAGGGGNNHNAGGGGGGNITAGGAGGYGWNSGQGDQTQAGGKGGAAVPASLSRFFLGGGGGGGDANNATSGVKGGVGGGIVIINANKIVGNGIVLANGGRGEAGRAGGAADGAGGGGAGGTIYIRTKEPSPTANLNIQAKGGNGGNTYTTTPHGPGGGGSGGAIYLYVPNAIVNTNINPGVSGTINDGASTNSNGATAGSAGFVNNFNPGDLPPYIGGNSATCLPILVVNKSRPNPAVPVFSGSAITYTIRVTNNGDGGAAGVRIKDDLPAGFTFLSATVTSSDNTTPAAIFNQGTSSANLEFGSFTIPGNSYLEIKVDVNISSGVTPGTYHNGAQVYYLDPTRKSSDNSRLITPAQNATDGNTNYMDGNGTVPGSNYDKNRPDEDVIVVKGNIAIEKTIVDSCPTDGKYTFNIIVKNTGTSVFAAGSVEVTDALPAGLQIDGTRTIGGTNWNYTAGSPMKFVLSTALNAGASSTVISIPVTIVPGNTSAQFANTAQVKVTSSITASSTAILYNKPTTATVTQDNVGACATDTYYLRGNVPVTGVGSWEFEGNNYGAVIATPNQNQTAVTNLPVGQLVRVKWVIKNGNCKSESIFDITRSAGATATLSTVNGNYCGAVRPKLTFTLQGTAPFTVTYLDGIGEIRQFTTNNNIYEIIPTTDGTFNIKSVKDGGGCNGVATGTVVITQSPASVGGTVSSDQVICYNSAPEPLVLSGFTGNVLRWQSSQNGGSWTDIPGSEATTIYTPPALTVNTKYRAVVQSGTCASQNSTEVSITVKPLITGSANIASQTVCNNNAMAIVSFTANSSGSTQFSWVRDNIANVTGIVSNGISATISGVLNNSTTTLQKVTFTVTPVVDGCSGTPFTVEVNVLPTVQGGTIGSDQTICEGETPQQIKSLVNAEAGTTYFWEQSENGVNWTVINGANAATYQPGPLTVNTYFRRTAQKSINSVLCTSVNPNVVTVSVNKKPSMANAGPDMVQNNSGEFTMNANAPVAGTGVWTIKSGNAIIENPNSRTTKVTIPENTTAVLTWTISNGVCAASADDVQLTYATTADLSIIKTVSNTTPLVGETVTFTVTAKNNGPSNATNVKVTELLKPGYDFVSATPSVGTYNAATGIWDIGNLNNQVFQTLSITAKVKANASTADYSNTASISGKETDPDPGNSITTITVTPTPVHDLAIEKTANLTKAVAGENIIYTLKLTNKGLSDLNGTQTLTVSESLPANFTILSVTSSAGAYDIVTGKWTNLQLAAGQNATINITGKVAANASSSITNAVSVTPPSGTVDTDLSNNTSTITTPIERKADLSVVKTANKTEAVAGESLKYTIVITNNGPSALLSTDVVKITETLPAKFAASSFVPQSGVYDATTGQWTGLTLSNGQSAVLEINGMVSADAKGTLQNTVNIIPPVQITDPLLSNNTSSITTPIKRVIDFEIVKRSDPAVVVAGENLSYVITLKNNGPGQILNNDILSVVDNLPQGFTVTGYTAQDGTYNSGNQTWTGLNLKNNEQTTLTITGKVDAARIQDLSNTVKVTPPADITDNVPSNNTSTITTTITAKPILDIVKNGMPGLTAGGDVTYTLEVNNRGSSNAVNAIIADNVPNDIVDVTWTATESGTAKIKSAAQGTGNVIQLTADFPADPTSKITVTIKGKVLSSAKGAITNIASVTPAEPSGTGSNSSVTSNLTSTSGVYISKTGNATVNAGTEIKYTIEVGNNGPSDAAAVKISDMIDSHITQVKWTSKTQGSATIVSGATGTGNALNSVANITAGATNKVIIEITGTVSADFAGVITNTATATPTEPGSTPVNGTTTANVINAATYTITKNGPASGVAGAPISYTVQVNNQGPSNSKDVLITDIVPSVINNVSWTAIVTSGTATIHTGATGVNNQMALSADMNANSRITITINGTINANAVGTITNTATVKPSEQGNNPVNSNTVNTTLTAQSGLKVTKSAVAVIKAGEEITYTIEVSNDGPSDAKNAEILDNIPVNILNPVWTSVATGNASVTDGANGNQNTLHATVNIGAGSGNKVAFIVKGKVDPSFDGSIINQVNVTATEPNSPNPQATVTTKAERKPVLTIVKTGPATLKAGQVINYTINISNTSTSDAKNLNISDVVNANITNVSWNATTSGMAQLLGPLSGTGNNISLQADLAAGAGNNIIITVSGTVKPNFGGSLVNTATVTPAEMGTTPASSTVTTVVDRKPTLTITKSGPQTISAGEDITYTIVVDNIGTANAYGALIADNIDPEIQNVTWIAVANTSATLLSPASGVGNNINMNADILAGGKITITVKGSLSPDKSLTIKNTATVTPTEPGTTPVPSNEITTNVEKKFNIQLVKTGTAKATSGESVSYVINAINYGPSNVKDLTITDLVPAQLTNVSWTATASGTSSVNMANGTGNNVSVIAQLQRGQANSVTITITGKIPSELLSTTLTNIAKATTPDSPGQEIPSNPVNTVVETKSVLSIIKSAPAAVHKGENIVYTLLIKNAGPSDANGVTITDVIPAGITDVKWMSAVTGAANVTYGSLGNGSSVSLQADIPAGNANSILIAITGKVAADYTGTEIRNTATVKTPTGTPVTSNETITKITKLSNVIVEKSGPSQAVAGEQISYTLTITNNGPSDENNLQIEDMLNASIKNPVWTVETYNGATASVTNGTGNVQFVGGLKGNGVSKIIIRISGTVDEGATITSISNIAKVTLPPDNEGPSPVSNEVITNISKVADLRIVKIGPANIGAGEEITYTLKITNQGPSTAVNTAIQDLVPKNEEYNENGPTGNKTPFLQNVIWTITNKGGATSSVSNGSGDVNFTATIPNGAEVIIQIKGKVDPSLSNGTLIVNEAKAIPDASITDPNLGNNNSRVQTNVDNNPTFRVSKIGPDKANIGDPISYVIFVNNVGAGNITDLKIVDFVPNEVRVDSWVATVLNGAVINGPTSGTTNNIEVHADLPGKAGLTESAVEIKIEGVVVPNQSTKIENSVVASAADTKISVVVTALSGSTDIRIEKTAPQKIAAGQNITYNLRAYNNGPLDVNGVVIKDLVPAIIENVNWKATANGTSAINTATSGYGNNIRLEGNLKAGSDNYINIQINGYIPTATTAQVINNEATIDMPTNTNIVDYNLANNISKVASNLINDAKVYIQKSGPNKATAGNQINYYLKIGNNGPSDAVAALITDHIATDIENVTWKAKTYGNATITANDGTGNNISFNADIPFDVNSYVVVEISGKIKESFTGNIENIAEVNGIKSEKVITDVTATTALSIKKAGPVTAAAGSNITYLIEVNNAGPSMAKDALIEDLVNSGLENVTWTATTENATIKSGGNGSGNTVNTVADIGANGKVTIVISGKLKTSVNTATIENMATVTETGNPPQVSEKVITQILVKPDLKITKSGPNQIAAGAIITYNLKVTNNGPSDALSAVIADIVPNEISNVSWITTVNGATISNGQSGNGNNVSVIADLPVNTSLEITITGTVNPAYQGNIVNTAMVSPAEPDGTGSTATVATEVKAQSLLTLDKSAPEKAKAGENITYILRVRNNGPSTAINSLITDNVPTEVTQVNWTAILKGNAQINGPLSGTGNNIAITATLPTAATDEIDIVINGVISASFSGALTNNATVTPNGGIPVPPSVVVTTVSREPVIDIVKTAPASITSGSKLTYQIRVSNKGKGDALNLAISDQVPAALTNVTWTAVAQGNASVTTNNGAGNAVNVTGNIPANPVNTIVIDITGDVPANYAGTIVNIAKATPSESGIAEKTSTVTTEANRKPIIKITKEGPVRTAIGENLTYKIKVTNEGTSDALNLLITDQVPPSISNVSWSTTVSGAAIISGANGTGNQLSIRANIPAGNNGMEITVTGKVNASVGTTIENYASVIPAEPGTSELKSNTVVTGIEKLESSKMVIDEEGDKVAHANEILTYQVLIKNIGGAVLNNVSIADVIPSGTTYVDNSANENAVFDATAKKLNWTTNLALGQSKLFNFKVKVTADVNGIKQIKNVAAVNHAQSGIYQEPQAVIPVEQYADIAVIKEALSTINLKTGDYITYRITVTNKGHNKATGVKMADVIPIALDVPKDLVMDKGTAAYDASSRTLTWNVGEMLLGETVSITFKTRIIMAQDIENTAQVQADQPDRNPTDNVAVSKITMIAGEELLIPNLFTPNGDGINDTFEIRGLSNYAENELVIINRWNNEVYSKKNYDNSWEGTGLNEGTYYYLLKVRKNSGSEWKVFKGYITLIRAFKK
ncbi:gliding motility-associated C-terminal domain-containing protein [Pedobacter sp.]|uniref:T9SS type B sorting domain-containing protein n=1 Tax=Pedobacter sp. TaxID=1411316 RepID=UPI00396C3B78